jgi:hypothetical protein
MYKVVVTINCDDCQSDFVQGRVSASSDAWEWNSEAGNLIGDAEQAGWDFFRGRMRCAACNCPQPDE